MREFGRRPRLVPVQIASLHEPPAARLPNCQRWCRLQLATIPLKYQNVLGGNPRINSAEAVVEGMGGNAEKQTPFLRYVDEFVGLSSAPTM